MLFFSVVARNARAATIRGGLFAAESRLLVVTVTCDDGFSGLSLTKSKLNTSASASTTNIFRDSHAHGPYNNNSHSCHCLRELLLSQSLSHPRYFSSNSSQSTSTSQSTVEDKGSGSGSPAGAGPTGSSTGSSLVWFLLVDEEGNAFKGARLDRIKLAKDADVVDFRKAVKSEFAGNRLKDVDPVDLQVYANEASFRSKEKSPLEADTPISGLGSSKKTGKVIYVVVPSFSTLTEKAEVALARANSFYESMMQPITDIPNSNNMREMRGVVNLIAGNTIDLILRSFAEPLWRKCINLVDSTEDNVRTRVCVVGTPGTGKSTNIAYLIRLLLENKEEDNTVVFLSRTKNRISWYYEFSHVDVNGAKHMNIKVYPERMEPEDVPSLQKSTTYYIVDPGMTKDSCNPSEVFLPKTIIVSSPDDKHWGGSEFDKFRDYLKGRFLYFPIWSLQELIAARNVLKQGLSEVHVCERFRLFGGVPRHVLDKDEEGLIRVQDFAINKLTGEQVVEIALKDFDAVVRLDAEQPKSAVVGFAVSTTSNDFERPEVNVISDVVAEKIYTKYICDLWNLMLKADETVSRAIFEPYTRRLMLQRDTYTARLCVHYKNATKRKQGNVQLQLGGCESIRLSANVVADARDKSHVVFHSTSTQHKLFDFIYYDENTKVFHAFQVTRGVKHKAGKKNIDELRASIGEDEKLRLYYLVPSDRYDTFVTAPVEPVPGSGMTTEESSMRVYHVMVPKPSKQQQAAPVASEPGPSEQRSEQQSKNLGPQQSAPVATEPGPSKRQKKKLGPRASKSK